MKTSRPEVQARNTLGLPVSALSSITHPLNYVVNVGLCPEFGFTSNGIISLSSLPHLEFGIFKVAERRHSLLAGFDTGRIAGPRPAVLRRNCIFRPRRSARVGNSGLSSVLDEGARVPEIEASRSVGTAGHAVPAADAAVKIHHGDAVRPLKGGLGGADPDTGRIRAVVAQDHERLFFRYLRAEIGSGPGKAFSYCSVQIHLISLAAFQYREHCGPYGRRDASCKSSGLFPHFFISTTMAHFFAKGHGGLGLDLYGAGLQDLKTGMAPSPQGKRSRRSLKNLFC